MMLNNINYDTLSPVSDLKPVGEQLPLQKLSINARWTVPWTRPVSSIRTINCLRAPSRVWDDIRIRMQTRQSKRARRVPVKNSHATQCIQQYFHLTQIPNLRASAASERLTASALRFGIWPHWWLFWLCSYRGPGRHTARRQDFETLLPCEPFME